MRRDLNKNLALVLLMGLAAGGCGQKPAQDQGHDYNIRAQVVQPPDATTGLYLYHEAVDDWVSRDGKVSGMDPMAMPFPVAKGVSVEGIEANDKIEATLHVDWDSDRPVEITKVRELPPDTKLVFRAAKPPQSP